MTARRSVRSQRKDVEAREGKKADMTLGTVSPTMTQKATMPPNALGRVRVCSRNCRVRRTRAIGLGRWL
jgi:uncharacterized Fe-S radical SAM superfamily protein PflX